MHAEKYILETDHLGNLKNTPQFPPDKQLEVIVLVVDDKPVMNVPKKRRTPHPDLVGKITIMGDIINCVPESDWEILNDNS